MDQVQIDIFQLQLFQGSINGSRYVFEVVADFGCDEEVFALDTGLLDGYSYLRFRVIQLSAIYVVIADFNRSFDGIYSGTINSLEVARLE